MQTDPPTDGRCPPVGGSVCVGRGGYSGGGRRGGRAVGGARRRRTALALRAVAIVVTATARTALASLAALLDGRHRERRVDLDDDVRAVAAHHVRLVDAVGVGLDPLDGGGRLLGLGRGRHLGGRVAGE